MGESKRYEGEQTEGRCGECNRKYFTRECERCGKDFIVNEKRSPKKYCDRDTCKMSTLSGPQRKMFEAMKSNYEAKIAELEAKVTNKPKKKASVKQEVADMSEAVKALAGKDVVMLRQMCDRKMMSPEDIIQIEKYSNLHVDEVIAIGARELRTDVPDGQE